MTDELNQPGVWTHPSFDPAELGTVDAPPTGGTPVDVSAPITTEYGQLMSGGGVHVRNGHPDIERIYPLAQWIPDHQRFGGKVLRRRVIVVEDWEEVTEP